jgi:Ala-tRNA(Pro) deacylase
MPANNLKEYLDKHQVKYVSMAHSPAFTSQEIAASAHISGRALAKTVVVKMDGKFAMVVAPADRQINFAKVRDVVGAKKVDLASESEFKDKFPGCEVGAMPPFGELYDMPVYLSSALSQHEHIIFNAGSHSELMQLTVGDFDRLVKPVVVEM